tara:strand:- start:289 stop:471 length:183 start_codon:yes stop_codon:yes gene_type:complete
MITYAKKIKPITTNKPKMTLKKVFQGYKQSSQKDKKAEPASKAVNNTNKKKNKKKNKNKY